MYVFVCLYVHVCLCMCVLNFICGSDAWLFLELWFAKFNDHSIFDCKTVIVCLLVGYCFFHKEL